MLQFDEIQMALAAAGLVVGAVASYVAVSSSMKKKHQALEAELADTTEELGRMVARNETQENQLALKSEEISQQHRELMSMQNQLGELTQKANQLRELQQDYRAQLDEYKTLQSSFSDLRARYDAQSASMAEVQKSHDEKLALMEAAEQRLQTQFENLANKIFETTSENFSKQSKTGLESILTPLKEQIETFKRQISDQYVKEGQERASL